MSRLFKQYLKLKPLFEDTNRLSPKEIQQQLGALLTTMRTGNIDVQPIHNLEIIVDETPNLITFYVLKQEVSDRELLFDIYTLDTQTLKFEDSEKGSSINMGIEQLTNEIKQKNYKLIPYSGITAYCQEIVEKIKNSTKTVINDKKIRQIIYNKTSNMMERQMAESDDTSQYTKMSKSMMGSANKSTVRMQVQYLIGDDSARTITNTKLKAENTLQLYQKKEEGVCNKLGTITVPSLIYDTFYQILEYSGSGKGGDKVILDKEHLGTQFDISPDLIAAHREDILKSLGVWPVEATCPMVFLNMDKSIQWGRDGDKSSKEILNAIFGDDGVFKRGLISFPSAGEELADSVVFIPTSNGSYRLLKISTKGGINGVGAQASLVSLFHMLFTDESFNKYFGSHRTIPQFYQHYFKPYLNQEDTIFNNLTQFIQDKCSPYGQRLFQVYPEQILILIIFGGLSPRYHKSVLQYLYNYPIGPIRINPNYFKGDPTSLTAFCNYINDNISMTDCVMDILNAQKYDFAQMNVRPNLEGDTFHYDYAVQYPAHFLGNVKLERGNVGIKFHIYG